MLTSKNCSVGREPRENHPSSAKAVVYEHRNGKKIKVVVWNPKCKTPKLNGNKLSEELFLCLRNEMLAIAAEEARNEPKPDYNHAEADYVGYDYIANHC